jgi:membrane protease YdiL (CAAX protease family)
MIRRHPLLVFFALAYGVSWLLWTPWVLSDSGLGVLPLRFPSVLGTTQLLGMLPGAYLGPLTAALIVTAVADGRPGLRHWSQRLVRWRVGWRWYVAVLVGVPGTIVLATLALPQSWGNVRFVGVTVLAAYIPMLVLQLLTTAVAEEPGWRDFALPRLQEKFGAVRGTVILGLLWGGWHLPLFLTSWAGDHVTWNQPVEFVAGCVPLSLVMTWVFNRSGQSLPLVMVLHASINSFYSLVWSGMFPTVSPSLTVHTQLIGSTTVALILIIATRGRLGLSTAPTAPTASIDEEQPGAQDRRLASSR